MRGHIVPMSKLGSGGKVGSKQVKPPGSFKIFGLINI
jgi:hypothetical protein